MLEVRTLTDGGQTVEEVHRLDLRSSSARRSGRSTSRTTTCTSGTETAAALREAIKAAVARGVAVRFLYNLDHRNPIPVPPPPEPDAS